RGTVTISTTAADQVNPAPTPTSRTSPEVRSVLNVPGALASRNGRGGTAPSAVAVQLTEVKTNVAAQHAWAGAKTPR
ncbi:hypothetical protein ACLMMR_41950, partial [Streptomyces sp. NPDC000405]